MRRGRETVPPQGPGSPSAKRAADPGARSSCSCRGGTGFSVHNRVYVRAEDSQAPEALVPYMMRPPVSLSRLRFTQGSHEVVYTWWPWSRPITRYGRRT